MKPQPLPELVPAKQASQETGIPYSTLRTAVHNGELPATRIGKPGSRRESWYFSRTDLLNWIASKTHQGKRQPRSGSRGVQGKGATFDDAA
jgi:excisionase family DNA binding protein